MRRPRFVVSSVTGYDEAEGSATARPRTDYYVLDTAYCHRVVASFPSRGHFHRADHRKRKAEQLAASLNAGDEAWRDAIALAGERNVRHA